MQQVNTSLEGFLRAWKKTGYSSTSADMNMAIRGHGEYASMCNRPLESRNYKGSIPEIVGLVRACSRRPIGYKFSVQTGELPLIISVDEADFEAFTKGRKVQAMSATIISVRQILDGRNRQGCNGEYLHFIMSLQFR